MWITPKTDWVPTDTYDIAVALTRVEGNLHEISIILAEIGMPVSLSEKLQWEETDFPTAAELSRISGNIRALSGMLTLPAGLPPVPTFDDRQAFTYNDANALEEYTAALYAVACGTMLSIIPCGMASCGVRPLWPMQREEFA